MSRCYLLTVLLVVMAAPHTFAAIWYVGIDNISGTEDGASWATAFTTIQPAIDAASSADEVWGADGTYTATTDPVVTTAVDVHLYGGFNGSKSSRTDRDWSLYASIIDGEDTRRGVLGANSATLDYGGVYNG